MLSVKFAELGDGDSLRGGGGHFQGGLGKMASKGQSSNLETCNLQMRRHVIHPCEWVTVSRGDGKILLLGTSGWGGGGGYRARGSSVG